MTAEGDLEDFIRVQKEKLSRERNSLDSGDSKNNQRRQWDRTNPDEVKQAVKENMPVRSETPEVPLAAKLGQHEERRKKLQEEKRQEYNQLQSRQTRNRRIGLNDDGGGVLPGLRDSQSAKQRKIAERNREYNEFLKAKATTGRRGQPLSNRGNESNVAAQNNQPQRQKPVETKRVSDSYDRDPPVRPNSQNRATSPISNEFINGYGVPRIDLGHSGRDFGPVTGQTTGADPTSLAIDDRAAELKRKETERNREYNEFLKQKGPNARGRRRETTPDTDFDRNRQTRDRSLGGAPPPEDGPRKGWGTPRYDEILEQKRREESQYRQGAFTMRPAVSEGSLDQTYDESRKLDRLDDVYETRKVRFRNELYGPGRPVKPILDDDGWLDLYKSPSRYDVEFERLPRSHTTLDKSSFQERAERVKSAPLRDQAPPQRTVGNVATSREQYRLELEQQMKHNEENRRRERKEQIPVNVSGLTEITRQNVDIDHRLGLSQDQPPPNRPSLQPDLMGAAGHATLGPYNSPIDEAYYYYSRRDPLDVGIEMAGSNSGYLPTVADPSYNQQYEGRRMSNEQKVTRVTFGPSTGQIRHKNESDLVTAAAIPKLSESDQKGIAKNKANNYQAELQRQIDENRNKKKFELEQRKREDAKLEAEIAGYNPFGKGGGGAPLKDNQGNVLADLKRLKNPDGTANSVPRSTAPPAPASSSFQEKPMSVYETYVSPRQQFTLDVPTTKPSAATQEPTFARGGHGIFGDPKTDAEKQAADRYKSELQLQIEEKKRRAEEQKAQQRLEEEREMKQIEEARLKMQREYEEEVRKQREKEENARKRNEELKLQAEEKRREAERLRRERNATNHQRAEQSRTEYELERERARLTVSPPIPTLRLGLKDESTARSTARRSPPVPALAKVGQLEPLDEPGPSARLDRAGSADVLNKLEVIRKQLHSERQRVENQLERDKFEVEVFDPRLVKAAPIPTAAVPIVMSPPVVHTPPPPRKTPDVDVFETAVNKAPVTVKRPPANNALSSDVLNEFNQLKNRDTDSRQKFRQMFPDQPVSGTDLEAQQIALLRQQEEELSGFRTEPTRGSRNQLQSESEYIDPNGIPVIPPVVPPTETAREKRRKKKVKVDSPKRASPTSLGSTASLNAEMNRKNENRLRKLRDLQGDDESLNDPDDILDRFISRQQHQRPSSGTTLNDEEAWLRPSH